MNFFNTVVELDEEGDRITERRRKREKRILYAVFTLGSKKPITLFQTSTR